MENSGHITLWGETARKTDQHFAVPQVPTLSNPNRVAARQNLALLIPAHPGVTPLSTE